MLARNTTTSLKLLLKRYTDQFRLISVAFNSACLKSDGSLEKSHLDKGYKYVLVRYYVKGFHAFFLQGMPSIKIKILKNLKTQ